ncbi:unnamed protein product [Oikopleura dioica]|uniref:MARVEL domain-containing protein n=1 Tax=Oikopleura dioica TaxID=34765 RepID=E4Y9R1_OIKDI|nr:unnamed protein product [Oikopleura dioica]
MNETETFYYNYDCDDREIFGAFVTAWIWVFFNKVIIGVTFCYGSAVTHKNVYAEYAVVWLICIFNFIACVLIIEVYFDGYYYNSPRSYVLTHLRACLAMSCLALIFSILVAIQVIKELCKAKNQQVRENIVQQPVVVQSVQPAPVPSAPTYVRLPNGQLQLIQTVQQPAPQTVYVQPRPIVPAIASEQHMHSFAVAQTLVMMTNIIFSGICVGYLGFGLNQCKT